MSQGTTWTVAVEMFGIYLQHGFQMVPREDQQLVGTRAADAADPPFGISICSWGLRWCPQYGDAGCSEDGVEGVGELGVPVANGKRKC